MRLGRVTIAVLTILLAMYFYIFHEGLSHDSNDWGNFGSYIGGVGSVIISAVAVIAANKANDLCNAVNKAISKEEQDIHKREKCIDQITDSYENITSLFSQYSNQSQEHRISLLIQSRCRIIEYYSNILPKGTVKDELSKNLKNASIELHKKPKEGVRLESLTEAYSQFMKGLVDNDLK